MYMIIANTYQRAFAFLGVRKTHCRKVSIRVSLQKKQEIICCKLAYYRLHFWY